MNQELIKFTGKQEIDAFAAKLISDVQEGHTDPLELHITLTALEKAIEATKKGIRTNVMSSSDKYSGKLFNAFNATIEKTEVGTKYDFTDCGDPQYAEAIKEEKAWSEKRKDRETFLKTLKGPMTIADEETGELIEVRPPVKTSESFIKVTIK